MNKRLSMLLVSLITSLGLTSCDHSLPTELAEWMEGGDDQYKVMLFYNATGADPASQRDLGPSDFLVSAIDQAQAKLDVCIYGFSKRDVIDAVIRAFYRGVEVRVVGDARHFGYGERGYRAISEHRIPLQVGNEFHIMHNKFFVIDDRFTFVGTGNMTTTGFTKNHNNWILIDSPEVAGDFADEFEQMFAGRFSNAKRRIPNGTKYQVGDTQIEVLFSPHEDTMGKILTELDTAQESVHFQIFAFTKDQVGSRFVRLHKEFLAKEEAELGAGSVLGKVNDRKHKVVGILDKSQLHGNGQYHEVYRMMSQGIPMRIDASANSYTPGDYQAGGGRLHTKTMIIDIDGDDPRVVTGSFNWSSSATIANDEVLMVLRGERITRQYKEIWDSLWKDAVPLPGGICNTVRGHRELDRKCGDEILNADATRPGDVIFSEVHWDGWNGLIDPADRTGEFREAQTNDEFLELYNTTDREIDLSLFTVFNGQDAMFGFTPGTVIRPGEFFLVLDHNIVPYSDVEPQRGSQAFMNADFVLNMANDPRFPRMNIRNSSLRLELRKPRDYTEEGRVVDLDPAQTAVVDAVGDFGPPFAGGRVSNQTFSMERILIRNPNDPTKFIPSQFDGSLQSAWGTCQFTQGGANVDPNFRNRIIATPGELNSQFF